MITTIKERPMLFSGPMVQALLAGTKTQTRRVVKPQPPSTWGGTSEVAVLLQQCPYGQPGDRLWVRETCRGVELASGVDGVAYVADGWFQEIKDNQDAVEQWMRLFHYRNERGATVPPIHMPRWASRILLEIVSVRVERLQDISEADAIAEGIAHNWGGWKNYIKPQLRYTKPEYEVLGQTIAAPVMSFSSLWISINGEDSYEANPWVWVVEFKRVEPDA